MTNSITCTACGGVGHIAKDCAQKRPGTAYGAHADGKNKMDDEVSKSESFFQVVKALGARITTVELF